MVGKTVNEIKAIQEARVKRKLEGEAGQSKQAAIKPVLYNPGLVKLKPIKLASKPKQASRIERVVQKFVHAFTDVRNG